MLYSHWLTQTGCSKHARVPATNKTVLLDFERSANEDVLWLLATLTVISTISDDSVLRVLLTIKLDNAFCPGPVRPADALKVIEYFRGGDKAPIWTTQ